ncbi:hypothetical protein HK405_015182, partial [Cladochytrium tenue]
MASSPTSPPPLSPTAITMAAPAGDVAAAAAVVDQASALQDAVIAWANTFVNISRRCEVLEDLSDGGVFLEILADIDGQWFKLVRSIDTGDNWVLKFNNLKKLYKLLTGYFEEVLGQNTSALDVPNLTAIARDSDGMEIVKLASLIIALSVQVENNQRYILQIQSLDPNIQHFLMLAIEQIMARLASSNQPASPSQPLSPFANEERLAYEKEMAALRKQVLDLQSKY